MLVAFGDSDPITGPMADVFKREMCGAQGIDHPSCPEAGISSRKTPVRSWPNK